MNKIIFFALLVVVFSSCEKDEDPLINVENQLLLKSIKQDGKLVESFTYDSEDKLSEHKLYFSDSLVQTEVYEYNKEGQLSQKTYGDYYESYEYDKNKRLLSTRLYYTRTNKEWQIKYEYKNGRINKGVSYYNGVQSGYIEFDYDDDGNTIERTKYPNWTEEDDVIDTKYSFSYDNKYNPIPVISRLPIDIIQHNNPVQYYHYNIIMSSMPPDYKITYDYNALGYPVRKYVGDLVYVFEYF